MTRLALITVIAGFALLAPTISAAQQTPADEKLADGIARGVAFLAHEVPAWAEDHGCYSCHNNGNAAQALYRARARKLDVPDDALTDTGAWLLRPETWKDNGGDPAFADETLANIQFAATLATALDCGAFTKDAVANEPAPHAKAVRALRAAADMIAGDQQPDGFWRIGGPNQIGAPATLGNTLATREALRALRAALDASTADQAASAQVAGEDFNRGELTKSIATAEAWLLQQRPERVFDAAALLLAMADLRAADKAIAANKTIATESKSEEQHPDLRAKDIAAAAAHVLAVIRKGQKSDGGFGPYVVGQPEPFDTAIVLLALARWGDEDDDARIAAARDFLLAEQAASGQWQETTRPAGNESYAQRISTTGWCVLALLESELSSPLKNAVVAFFNPRQVRE